MNGVDLKGGQVRLYCNDSMEVLKTVKDKSIDLILIDPPYNIKKAEWDNIDNYIEWMSDHFLEFDRILKDNGSFYFFHNDFESMVELHNYIRNNTGFKFKRLITWNKVFDGCDIEGFAKYHMMIKGLRNYQNFAEYCLFYTKQNGSGLLDIKHDTTRFPTLRKYFKDMQEYIGLNINEINRKMGSRRAEHSFYHNSTQWELCTPGTYKDMEDIFNIREWDGFVEYEELQKKRDEMMQKYENERYTFNNQGTHHSVWNYNVAPKKGHITPKPVDLLENILKYSSNEGDVVLDCFMGSGSTGVACVNLDREFIGVDNNNEYFNLSIKNIKKVIQGKERNDMNE